MAGRGGENERRQWEGGGKGFFLTERKGGLRWRGGGGAGDGVGGGGGRGGAAEVIARRVLVQRESGRGH